MPHVGIYVTGRIGAGVTTFGANLASRLCADHFETDNFSWEQTDPPFRSKRQVPEFIHLIETAMNTATNGWVLAGSITKWGDPLLHRFTHGIYIDTPTSTRLRRLEIREHERYGARIQPGGDMFRQNQEFMEAAIAGRTREREQDFLARLACPTQTLDGTYTPEVIIQQALDFLAGTRQLSKVRSQPM